MNASVFDCARFVIILWGALGYICIGGFAWALTPEHWGGDDHHWPAKIFASIFWPVTLSGYLVYRVAGIGPRAVKAWRERGRLPRAEVHRSRDD